jgi:DNA repair exonuclease SbcCD ATPase subunit
MRILSLALQGMRGWPDVEFDALSAGLNVFTGPPQGGKSTLAAFLAHVLFGKPPVGAHAREAGPEGEATVESHGAPYRLRRYHDGTRNGRLTVAALDGQPVDRETIPRLLSGLSPGLAERYFAATFAAPPAFDSRAAGDFADAIQSLSGITSEAGRKANDLAARRDALAQELESRIAGERRASGELENRRRDIDRRIHDAEQSVAALDLRLRAADSALAETDARLRYRRLELNAELRWHAADDTEPRVTELDTEIAHWRGALADLARREADVRTRLAQVAPADLTAASFANQRAWTSVARQLAADLEGEVARLARAGPSQQCVCQDAHPRLRPIVETLARQINTFETLLETQERAARARAWAGEAEQLARTQTELRKQLEQLLDRRQAIVDEASRYRPWLVNSIRGDDAPPESGHGDASHTFSAADAEQLEQRRLELEQQRFELVEAKRDSQRAIRTLRSDRADLARQRAALLSARSIEHVQRELADVQRKLEQATFGGQPDADLGERRAAAWRASDFLAQLTGGRLVRLELSPAGGPAWAVRETGARVALELLSPAERDQVQLSCMLALAAAAAQRGVALPFLLDEPFAQLDGSSAAALAAVLDGFARQGHQVLVFTSQPAAIERFASLGAAMHDIVHARRYRREPAEITAGAERLASDTSAATRDETQKAKQRSSATSRVRRPVTRTNVRRRETGSKKRGNRGSKADGRDAA